MKLRRTNSTVGLLLVAASLALSCQRGGPMPASAALSSPARTSAATAANDYSKPYLTDDKMQQFLASMKEEYNPLELLFKKGGAMRNPATMSERIDEFNAFARKYGFQDYQDYTAVWGRIMAGQMQIFGQETFQNMITSAQAELKKPNVAPEMQKVYQEQIASAQKGLDDMNNNSSRSAVNSADMELVKKYKDQIEAAQKKYNN